MLCALNKRFCLGVFLDLPVYEKSMTSFRKYDLKNRLCLAMFLTRQVLVEKQNFTIFSALILKQIICLTNCGLVYTLVLLALV